MESDKSASRKVEPRIAIAVVRVDALANIITQILLAARYNCHSPAYAFLRIVARRQRPGCNIRIPAEWRPDVLHAPCTILPNGCRTGPPLIAVEDRLGITTRALLPDSAQEVPTSVSQSVN